MFDYCQVKADDAGVPRTNLWQLAIRMKDMGLAWVHKARATVSKRAKLSNLAADLADHERAYLLDLFNLADADGGGSITMDELLPFLESKGIALTQAEVDAAVRTIDENHDGSIDYDEFVALLLLVLGTKVVQTKAKLAVNARQLSVAEKRLLRRQFDAVRDAYSTATDAPTSDVLTVRQLREFLAKRGKRMTRAEIDAVLAQIDENNDGQIDCDEFISANILVFGLSKLRRAAKIDKLTKSLADAELNVLKQQFATADADGSGHLSLDELRQFFMHVGHPLTEHETLSIVHQIDEDFDGRVDYDEFVAANLFVFGEAALKRKAKIAEMARALSAEERAELSAEFQRVDVDGSGKLSMEELVACLTAHGEACSADELTEILRQVDDNFDGMIDLTEWVAVRMLLKRQRELDRDRLSRMRRRSTLIAQRRTAGGADFARLKHELAMFAEADTGAADGDADGDSAAATVAAVARLRRRRNHTRLLEQMIEACELMGAKLHDVSTHLTSSSQESQPANQMAEVYHRLDAILRMHSAAAAPPPALLEPQDMLVHLHGRIATLSEQIDDAARRGRTASEDTDENDSFQSGSALGQPVHRDGAMPVTQAGIVAGDTRAANGLSVLPAARRRATSARRSRTPAGG
jgi:Ca2+-binding EF-hand superfamily protein